MLDPCDQTHFLTWPLSTLPSFRLIKSMSENSHLPATPSGQHDISNISWHGRHDQRDQFGQHGQQGRQGQHRQGIITRVQDGHWSAWSTFRWAQINVCCLYMTMQTAVLIYLKETQPFRVWTLSCGLWWSPDPWMGADQTPVLCLGHQECACASPRGKRPIKMVSLGLN